VRGERDECGGERAQIALAQVEQEWNLPLVDAPNRIVSPKIVEQAGTAVAASLRPTLFNFFARLLLPGLGNFAKKTAYAQNAADLARVAIALERYRLAHGEFPESLDVLAPQFLGKIPHDIINGGSLHYRRTGDGQYILYSVGWNENDDGGVVAFKNGSSAEINPDAGDWVWRYPAK